MFERKIDRLLITLHPRSGKSEFISKYYPAWLLGKDQDHRIILASYEADFAAEWGRKVRDLLDEHGDRLFGIKLRQDSKAADHWQVANGIGGMQTCGVGGPLTGKGAATLLVDDDFKNAEEANSETIRAKKWDWFTTAAYTRLEPGGAIVKVGTRWHEADTSGRVLAQMKEGGDQWTYLHLPALSATKEVWADLTLPAEFAEKLKVHENQEFRSLEDFFAFAKQAA